MLQCVKCAGEIPVTSQSVRYCSRHCSKLFLKAQSKKRNREKVNEYKRRYREQGSRHPSEDARRRLVRRLGGKCERCDSPDSPEVHHIKPLRLGGTNEARNLLLLCKPCHQLWHNKFDNDYWLPYAKGQTKKAWQVPRR